MRLALSGQLLITTVVWNLNCLWIYVGLSTQLRHSTWLKGGMSPMYEIIHKSTAIGSLAKHPLKDY